MTVILGPETRVHPAFRGRPGYRARQLPRAAPKVTRLDDRVSGGRRHFALRLSAVAGPARILPTGTTCLPADMEMRL